MRLFYIALACILIPCGFTGCGAVVPKAEQSRVASMDELFGELSTNQAPLPFEYESWPANSRFHLQFGDGEALLVEIFGKAIDRETMKVVALIELKPSNKKERLLWYYTLSEASIKNIYQHPTFFYTQLSADLRAPQWKFLDYNTAVPMIDKALRKLMGFSDVQLAQFHILYMTGVFQAMFQVAEALEKGEVVVPAKERPGIMKKEL